MHDCHAKLSALAAVMGWNMHGTNWGAALASPWFGREDLT
jgi:hypothetical protein